MSKLYARVFFYKTNWTVSFLYYFTVLTQLKLAISTVNSCCKHQTIIVCCKPVGPYSTEHFTNNKTQYSKVLGNKVKLFERRLRLLF